MPKRGISGRRRDRSTPDYHVEDGRRGLAQRQDPGASSTADECNRGYNTLVLGAAVCWSVPDWQQLVRRSSEIISRPSKPAAWL
jgi:hypothetical protein